MQIIRRKSKIKEELNDEQIEKVQFWFNSDHHFGMRILLKNGEELVITLTAAQTRELLMFIQGRIKYY